RRTAAGDSWPVAERSDLLACDVAIVERDRAVAKLLHGFVTAAGDHDGVAGTGLAKREPDRTAAVRLDEIRPAPLLRARFDLGDDVRGVFRTRVVARDHRQIGDGRRGGAHERSLRPVAVSA